MDNDTPLFGVDNYGREPDNNSMTTTHAKISIMQLAEMKTEEIHHHASLHKQEHDEIENR